MFPVLSCTAQGFSCPVDHSTSGGLLPRLFTLTHRLTPLGGIFSVTLSVMHPFQSACPRVLHGMLSGGVRTFLWHTRRIAPPDLPAVVCHPLRVADYDRALGLSPAHR
jgi:hypothetical protein